ncbi:hypothetical protein MtrunA17_Chr3g0131311 [Medicago truncatula]|uniref:Uncharacterized protein n=1 Tax=Medicago truncatula TaxID=3880 RepID=A0A396J0Z4_MEDTR|nr:hypothetical protein MtrunA17_Chr3g0131311 [Medicago truncatula]
MVKDEKENGILSLFFWVKDKKENAPLVPWFLGLESSHVVYNGSGCVYWI